jgi:hypothetical protein
VLTRIFRRSRRQAHRRWQELERRRAADLENLKHIRDLTAMAAKEAGVEAPEEMGVLQQASQLEARPDPHLLRLDDAVRLAFAIMGTSCWRSAPDNLHKLLEQYEARVVEHSRECDHFCRRLALSGDLLKTLQSHPEYAAGLSPRKILEFPEYAEAMLELGKARAEHHQLFLTRLKRCFAARLDLGYGWLRALTPEMTAYAQRLTRRQLKELQTSSPDQAAADLRAWAEKHSRLDPVLLRLNRKALQFLAPAAEENPPRGRAQG